MTHPDKIQAITIPRHGGPEVIEKTQIPVPEVDPRHIIVKVTLS